MYVNFLKYTLRQQRKEKNEIKCTHTNSLREFSANMLRQQSKHISGYAYDDIKFPTAGNIGSEFAIFRILK